VPTPIIVDDENVNPDEATDWLHRNDNYEHRRRSEQTFPSDIPSATPKGSQHYVRSQIHSAFI
jgi:hypothetical protein